MKSNPLIKSPRLSLAIRLALSFALPTVLASFALAFFADQVAQRAFEEQLSQRLISVAHAERAMLAGYFTELLERVDEDDQRSLENLRKRITPIAEETEVRRVFLFRPDDFSSIVDTNPEVRYGQKYYEQEADAEEISRALEGESVASVLYHGADGTPYKYAYTAVFSAEDGRPIAIIGVEGSATQVAEVKTLRRDLATLGIVALLAVFAISFLVGRRLRTRVDRLSAAAERIGGGDLEAEISVSRRDELGDLERAIDTMRGALKGREEEMQMMLSGIAHEVRNPLGGMELFLGLLDEDLEDERRPDDPRREHVARLKRELAYLARVVNEFLAFARRQQLDIARFEAQELCQEILEVTEGDLCSTQCQLQVSCEEGLELTADRDRLKRTLVNLIRNAWQASPPERMISLKLKAPQEGWRQVVVRDQGEGIPEDQLEDILRPFFTTREKGTGLGLPLARKVILEHRGRFEIESQVGEGTTISISLPFDDTLAKAQEMIIPDGWLG